METTNGHKGIYDKPLLRIYGSIDEITLDTDASGSDGPAGSLPIR
jgi:hypothetical protein